MALDLGALIARVIVEDAEASRTITLLMARFRSLGSEATGASKGTTTLDESLAALGKTSTDTAIGVGRTTKATADESVAAKRAATAEQQRAAAVERVAAVMKPLADATAREQAATLRATAAAERETAVREGTASAAGAQAAATARLAGAQAAAIGASSRLAASQESSAARMASAGKTMSHAITLPVLAAVAVAVDQAAKFQTATNVYVTAAGELPKNLGIVRDGIKRVAMETGTSLDQLTAAEYLAEKAHLRGAAGITVLEAAAKGAREENANLADVMQGETSIMASYHLKASDAVEVTNALKTGAGSAKVTMEEYVKALSTVIPVASAAGVSISEVLGAESTLTQHGTSANEATQELSNTLRGLEAPNNVAVAAMNQLGISSVNVSRNLGSRGLSGTIAYIESQMPKAGLVYLTAMRQMEAGTSDLNQMVSKMPPSLATLSKGFLNGTVSAKDYRTAFKDLGAEGYAQGTQFLALATKVNGYNDSLRNGTPAQKTMASELKAIFGGATGLNTVLQLGGQNLDGFKGRVDQVSKSLHDGTKDVEGWQSTSHLASVEAGKFKESLQVLAINGGTAILPFLTTVAKDATGVVKAFQGMSGTQKEIIGWTIGILAAMGPVLAIGGKLGLLGAKMETFAVGAASSIAKLSGASAETALRVTTITTNMVRGVQGVLAGALAGQFFGSSGGGWLASIMLGGAGGWALGGPVAGAIGAVSAVITKGIGLWNDHKNAARAAAEAESGFITNLTSAIQADNGALGTNLRLVVTKQLQDSGILTEAQKLGFNLSTTVAAAMGSSTAKQSIGAAISKQVSDASSMLDRILKPLGLSNEPGQRNALISGAQQFDPNQLYNAKTGNKVGLSASQIADAKAAIAAAQGANKYGLSLNKMGIDISQARTKADQFSHALNDNRVNTGSLASQLESLRKKTTVALDANGNLTNSLRAGTVVGIHNRGALISMANAAEKDANNTFAAALQHHTYAQSVQIASSALGKNVKAIESAATAAGFNKTQVDQLITSLGLYSRLHPSVTPALNNGPAMSKIHATGQALYALNAQKTDPTVTINDDATDRLRQLIGYLHVFGMGATATVSVSTPTGVHQLKASGGTITGTGGPKQDNILARLSVGEEVIQNPYAGRYRGLLRAINSGAHIPGYASGGTVGGTTDPLVTRTLHGPLGSGIVGIAELLKSQIPGASAAMADLSKAVDEAFQLKGVEREIANITKQLATVTEYRNSVMSTVSSSFQQQQYGSVGDLLAGFGSATSSNQNIDAEISKLTKEGVPKAYLSQLISSGQFTTIDTLAHASMGQLAQVDKAVGAYNSSLYGVGRAATLQKYGTTVGGLQGQLDAERAQQERLVGGIAKLVGVVADLTGQPVSVSIDGEVAARAVFRSREMEIVLDELGNVIRYQRAH